MTCASYQRTLCSAKGQLNQYTLRRHRCTRPRTHPCVWARMRCAKQCAQCGTWLGGFASGSEKMYTFGRRGSIEALASCGTPVRASMEPTANNLCMSSALVTRPRRTSICCLLVALAPDAALEGLHAWAAIYPVPAVNIQGLAETGQGTRQHNLLRGCPWGGQTHSVDGRLAHWMQKRHHTLVGGRRFQPPPPIRRLPMRLVPPRVAGRVSDGRLVQRGASGIRNSWKAGATRGSRGLTDKCCETLDF
jgi:hypothetical protein